MENKRIVFLYTELAGYFLAALQAMSGRGYEITVFHWKVNAEAPFQLTDIPGVEFRERANFSDSEISNYIKDWKPRVVLCSGWIDKGYLKAIKSVKGPKKVVLMDNQEEAGIMAALKTRVKGVLVRNIFSHAWVPGKPQVSFAKSLGFSEDEISTGFYTADTTLFQDIHKTRNSLALNEYPKTFLFVGRYIHHKGIAELWTAFENLVAKTKTDWKLLCVGTGEQFPSRKIHPQITHYGFKQPEEMAEIIAQSGVLVLPSHFEPWGVVVHEMASAGLPLLLSNKVGAASQFLETGKNGWSFNPGNSEELEALMLRITSSSEEDLKRMSMHSHKLSLSVSTVKWCDTLIDLL